VTSSPDDTAPPAPALDPWARWGWVMGAAWIVFLGYPIAAVLQSAQAPGVRVLALVAIVAYAAVYIAAFVRLMRDETPVLGAWVTLAVLIALIALAVPAIGVQAIGMTPYLVSYAMFAYRWPLAPVVSGVILLAVLAVIWLTPTSGLWFFVILLPLIFGFTLLVRTLNYFGDRHRQMSEQMAVVDERERVARDVHDVLGHSLTAITVKTELAERMIDLDPERAKSELAQVRTLTRDALAEIRSTVAGLRATRIEDELEHARDALRSAGIEADLPATADAVDPVNRIVLGWAMREAATNVVRHSRARHCAVELGSASLVVTDDGVGPASTDVPSTQGNGLRGLRERVAQSGGTVELGPGPTGSGARLEVRL
jgi:two-component system, NarL family, sensor histidine kinase DesK